MLLDIILTIENFCNQNNINHRFVGGVSFGGLLNSKTRWKIDPTRKKIILYNYTELKDKRKDNTLRDIDLILFEKDKNKINKLSNFIYSRNFPQVTVESAVYSPEKINSLTQFVTSIYISNNVPFLLFGSVSQKITWESLEPWTVILNKNISYIVRNPIADYFAYKFRSPAGIKQKDKDKVILLKRLISNVINEGKKQKINFISENYYEPWKKYIKSLEKTKDKQIILKKRFMHVYWSTIGEYLSHGKGISRHLNFLQNKFTGS